MKIKIIIVKILTRLLNVLSYLHIPIPANLIDKTLRFAWNHPWMIKPIVSTIRPEELEKMSKKLVVHHFKKYTPLVPALSQFYKEENIPKIKNFDDFQKYVPETTKDIYVKKYPLEYRCINGRLPDHGTLYKSAGTSGKATIWAQSAGEEEFFEKYVQFGVAYAFQADIKNYKIINCWAFGTWPTAIDFTKAGTKMGQMVNVGTKMDEVLEVLQFLGKNYRYIIVGYPPFLSYLFKEGEKLGFNWREWYIHVLSGGEGFIEEWREQIQNHLGPEALVYSAFGSTDLGLSEGMETFLTVAIRRISFIYQTFLDDSEEAKKLAVKYFPKVADMVMPKDKENVRKFFMQLFKTDPFTDRRLPMIFQYNPTTYFNEEVVTDYESRQAIEIRTTTFHYQTACPRVRYNIKDERGIIKYKEMLGALKSFDIDMKKVVFSINFNDKDILHLPFFYIYGRSDGTISIDGANIFPADVEELIADNKEFNSLINSFIMEVTNDNRLGFDFELKRDAAAPSGAELEKIKLRFKELLAHYSSSFRDIVKEELKSSDLVINFHPFGLGPFESSPLASARLIKYRYIRR